MRLSPILPRASRARYPSVATCPYAGCGGSHFPHGHAVPKPLRDTVLTEVIT